MNIKNVFAFGLLLFVAAAVATAVVKQSGEEPLDASSANLPAETVPTNGLVATFFHGNVRCPTCQKIENYAHQAIEEGFADQMASGEVQWKTTNYETPANTHFTEDYGIFSSTVVLVRMNNGKPVDWRNLNRVWELIGDEQAFKGYVTHQAREMMNL